MGEVSAGEAAGDEEIAGEAGYGMRPDGDGDLAGVHVHLDGDAVLLFADRVVAFLLEALLLELGLCSLAMLAVVPSRVRAAARSSCFHSRNFCPALT